MTTENNQLSEQELRSVFDNLIDLFYRTDKEGKITQVSESSVDVIGYTPEELIGTVLADLYDEPSLRQTLLERLEKNDHIKNYEVAIRHKRGYKIWVSVNLQLYYHNDEVAGVEGLVRDITKLKQTEMALQESEQQMRSIFNNMMDTYYRTDSQGFLIMMSPSVTELLKYDPEDLLGKRLSDLYVHPEQRDRLLSELEKNNGQYYGFEAELYCKDGSKVWVSTNVRYCYDKDGKFAGVEGITRDISKIRNAMTAMHESEHQLRVIFDNMMDAYYRTDREGKLVMASPSVKNLMLYDLDEVIGKPLYDFYADASKRDEFLEELNARGGHYYGHEAQMVRKDGKPIWVMTNAQYYFDEEGNIAGVEGMTRDITTMKEAELEILQSKETAEAANRAKSEFLSSMSHELRTPLNSILGFSDLLVNHSDAELSDKDKRYVESIKKGGAYLKELIDQVLDLAKIETGKIQLYPEVIQPKKMAQECLNIIQPLANKFRVNVKIDISESERLPGIYADNLRLRQALINLLSNSVKYNKENGEVLIKCRHNNSGYLQFVIADTGMGIPKDSQKDVFKPFSRLGRESGNIEGSGIGLTITAKLVEMMNGGIGFTSSENVGSEFWVEIPIAKDQGNVTSMVTREISSHELEKSDDSNITILYVEDNPMNMSLMEEIIATMNNVALLTAINGRIGLQIAESKQPDIIFLDIGLPDIDGFEVLKNLQKGQVTKNIPVYALSANAMSTDIEKGLEAGFLDYICKPYSATDILVKIDLVRKSRKQ